MLLWPHMTTADTGTARYGAVRLSGFVNTPTGGSANEQLWQIYIGKCEKAGTHSSSRHIQGQGGASGQLYNLHKGEKETCPHKRHARRCPKQGQADEQVSLSHKRSTETYTHKEMCTQVHTGIRWHFRQQGGRKGRKRERQRKRERKATQVHTNTHAVHENAGRHPRT